MWAPVGPRSNCFSTPLTADCRVAAGWVDRRHPMPINLPALVARFLTPDVIGRIASALGIDRNIAQTAINAVVPSLLAGFGGVAAHPRRPRRRAAAPPEEAGTPGDLCPAVGCAG